MDFQRLILFGALGMVLLLLWQSWLEYEADKNGTSFNAATSAQPATTQGAWESLWQGPQDVISILRLRVKS